MTTTNTNPPADDHGPSGPPPAEVIARGYESDGYDTKSVLSVPLLVVFFFVGAFGTVSILFHFIAKAPADPKAHPAALARNKRPLNERLAGVGNEEQNKQTRVQPRLDQADMLSGGDLSRSITQNKLPVAEGNSPQLHPEDLRPTKDRFPALYASGGGKYGLDKTMELSDDALKGLFPVQKAGSKPTDSQHAPTAANAGRGAEESAVKAPAVPKIPAPAPDPKGGKP